MPSGSTADRKGKLLIVPSTIVTPRDGSFALALFGSVKTLHDPVFSVPAGRNNLARKQIVDLDSRSPAGFICRHTTNIRRSWARLYKQNPFRGACARIKVNAEKEATMKNEREGINLQAKPSGTGCVECLAQAGWFASPPGCSIDVVRAPRSHVGLGSGTQLALATALGLAAFLEMPTRPTAGTLPARRGSAADAAVRQPPRACRERRPARRVPDRMNG